MSTEDFEKSLSDEATLAGAAKRRPTAEMSLGDERTLGDRLGDQDTVINDIEVVDLEARYRVEGTLGRGGMGEVLLALDTRLGRKVAIKRILGEAARSKTAIMRFLTEAKAIAVSSQCKLRRVSSARRHPERSAGERAPRPHQALRFHDQGTLQGQAARQAIAREDVRLARDEIPWLFELDRASGLNRQRASL